MERSLAVRRASNPVKLTEVARRSTSDKPVAHWGIAEVKALVEAARAQGRGWKGNRDAVLIQVLFDGALRVSEALGLRPTDVIRTDGGYRLQVHGKAGYRPVPISPSMAALLQAHAYEHGLAKDALFFPINRHRVHQLVARAAVMAGLSKPAGVGQVHVLRHSGALERLRLSRNPASIQHFLGHSTPSMTMRYLKTLTVEEALELQESVDLGW